MRIGKQEQSAVNLIDKRQWVYTYTYLLSLAILADAQVVADKPLRCLVIGLGGGSFADFLADQFPRMQVEVVEINPVIIRLAREYFPINARIQIIAADARKFLRDTKKRYDVIVMDAFGEHAIPADLYTLEYFSLLKSRLAPTGLALMNSWESRVLDARELATLAKVFPQGYYLSDPREYPGNRIYLMGNTLDSEETIRRRISGVFMSRQFRGEDPVKILNGMQPLRAKAGVEPITDRNVRLILQQANY